MPFLLWGSNHPSIPRQVNRFPFSFGYSITQSNPLLLKVFERGSGKTFFKKFSPSRTPWHEPFHLSKPVSLFQSFLGMEAEAQDSIPHLVRVAILGEEIQGISHGLDDIFGVEVFGVPCTEG